MTAPAYEVAAALRQRLPGLPTKKLHKLLYYCQGHHLAAFGTPLFAETISAWDMGPVVGTLWHDERNGGSRTATGELTEAELNTIGYVVSRYGALTGRDLEVLTHAERPWQRADERRMPKTSVRIETAWIEEQFRSAASADDDDDVVLDADDVRDWLADAESRRSGAPPVDSLDEIRRRLADLV